MGTMKNANREKLKTLLAVVLAGASELQNALDTPRGPTPEDMQEIADDLIACGHRLEREAERVYGTAS